MLDRVLDQVASIRDEYLTLQGKALDQMELHAAQGDARETSAYSSEAERHGAAILACRRILTILERPSPVPADAGEPKTIADKIIGEIEARFPNWRSYRDLIDCIDCTLHELRSDIRPTSAEEPGIKAHDWFVYNGMTSCRACGYLRNSNSDARPCRGAVKVELRADPATNQSKVSSVEPPREPDVWPLAGDRMRFLDRNGYPGELAEARTLFTKDQIVTVKNADVGSFSHSVEFDEFPGKRFNGVMFELVTRSEGKEG